MLSLARQIPRADGLLRNGHWAKHQIEGQLLRGKTLGIYGAGNIGGQVGEMGMAWGMDVIGCVASPSDDRARELRSQGIELVSSDDVLRRADFLVLTLPLDSSTRYIIDADAIAAMRPGAFLINVARGGVVDEQALASAVRSGHLAGAGMDVHEREGEGALSPARRVPQRAAHAAHGGRNGRLEADDRRTSRSDRCRARRHRRSVATQRLEGGKDHTRDSGIGDVRTALRVPAERPGGRSRHRSSRWSTPSTRS